MAAPAETKPLFLLPEADPLQIATIRSDSMSPSYLYLSLVLLDSGHRDAFDNMLLE
ncbi:hypothetical protein D3C73_1319240 [compost metagenome]